MLGRARVSTLRGGSEDCDGARLGVRTCSRQMLRRSTAYSRSTEYDLMGCVAASMGLWLAYIKGGVWRST